MFQRCIDIKEPLISTLAIIGNVQNLSPDDFDIMEHYCSIFKPFKEMTAELNSEKGVSISKTQDSKKRGFSKTTSYQRAYQTIIQSISTIIQSKKNNVSEDEVNDIQENTNENEQFDIWKDFDLQTPATTITTPRSEAIVELDKYLNEPLLDRKSDPLMWWKEMKRMYPNLFQLALLRLCVPSTSVPCERIFSKAGYTITDRRNRLSMKNAETLLFLNSYV
ncbi:unnamed protein product [Macrosiphum euphorbiae]|uniref:HAT C-terminal dimerisation domain-containing protein n=1 Tax=Macrosiphum euphorbiae TaxID=13131 RepID=A0AAV0WTS8_9HEMI|nr:unnamed protein product [Macrosiphum euphorbiae]